MRGRSGQDKILCPAGTRQGLRASGFRWLLRLLVLAGVFIYLPADAFDGDAVVGFDEALVESFAWCCGLEGIAPQHPAPPGAPAWRDVTSVRPVAALAVSKPNGPARRQVLMLRASRLCARSRIGEGPVSGQQHVTSARWIPAHALFTASTDVRRAFVFTVALHQHNVGADLQVGPCLAGGREARPYPRTRWPGVGAGLIPARGRTSPHVGSA